MAKEVLAYAGHAILLPVGPGRDPDASRHPGTHTILLVHGYMARASVLRPLRFHLRRRGHTRFLSFAHRGIDVARIAEELAARVEAAIPEGRIDVVAHSLGGLAVRYWLQELGGATRVDRCVLLGVPHRGSVRAHLRVIDGMSRLLRPPIRGLRRAFSAPSRRRDIPLRSPSLATLRDLRPGSPLLERLEEGTARAAGVRFTSVVAQGDLMVRPPESAAFEQGEVHRLPGIGHNGLLFSPRVFRIVAEALDRRD